MTEYERGYNRGLRAAWTLVADLIKSGPLPEPQASQRNGMCLAANAIFELRSLHGDTDGQSDAER